MIFDESFTLAHHINIRLSLGVDEVISAMKYVPEDPQRSFQVAGFVLCGVRVDVKIELLMD